MANALSSVSQPQEMKECIDNCLECYRICLETLQYSLEKGGKNANSDHIRLLQNCAAICETSAQFMITGSEFHPMTCDVCAHVCRSCAEDCDGFKVDSQMQLCADMCRRCAESCETMSGGKKRITAA